MSKYKVAWVEHITPGFLGISLEHSEGNPILFMPGQYATFSFVRHHRPSAARCFSIASSPSQPNKLEFGMRIGGKFTTALTKLMPGDTVHVGGPYGSFVFDSASQQKVVLCAGGIGITPFMSMMRYATELRLTNELVLVFSVRSQEDIPYFEELKRLASENPRLTVVFVVDSGETNLIPDNFKIFSGRISPEVFQAVNGEDFLAPSFFICGPPPFVKGASSILSGLGVPKEKIITEAFSQGNHKQTGRSRLLPANIYVLGAVGALACSVIVMSSDLIKSIPSQLLPSRLTNDQNVAGGRAQDLDSIVNGLEMLAVTGAKSPAVLAAEQEVATAQAQADEVNRENALRQGPTYVASSGSSSTSGSSAPAQSSGQAAAPAPTPAPVHVPVCKTSASGVKTCI